MRVEADDIYQCLDGAELKERIAYWPLFFEVATCATEKDIAGVRTPFLRFIIRNQCEVVRVVDCPLSSKDAHETWVDMAAHFVEHINRMLFNTVLILLNESLILQLRSDDRKKKWIEEVIDQARRDVRARVGQKHGGSQPVMSLVGFEFLERYQEIYPAILEAKKQAQKIQKSFDSSQKSTWRQAAQKAWKDHSIPSEFSVFEGIKIKNRYPELPDEILDEFTIGRKNPLKPSELALELAARATLSWSSVVTWGNKMFIKKTGYSMSNLKLVLAKSRKIKDDWEEYRRRAWESAELMKRKFPDLLFFGTGQNEQLK